MYFTLEWGSESHDGDKTFDTEFTPRAAQIVNTLVGIKPIDEDTIEVYVNYWHFDEGEIAGWASVWSTMPWEIYASMERAVIDGKASFSRSGAVSKSVNWLSLIVPNDSMIIKENIESFRDSNTIPNPLTKFVANEDYVQKRYAATLDWIDVNNHAVISNGPFYLDRYSPESRTIQINAFEDESYPFGNGFWNKFEEAKFPKITSVDVPNVVSKGKEIILPIDAENTSKLYYFVTNSEGKQISSGIKDVSGNTVFIELSSEQTNLLSDGANDLKVFAISDDVLRPDIFSTSFLALASDDSELPQVPIDDVKSSIDDEFNYGIIIVLIIVILVGTIFGFKIKSRIKLKEAP